MSVSAAPAFTGTGVCAFYVLPIGEHECHISFVWEERDANLTLHSIKLDLNYQATAYYQTSDRFNGQLALDPTSSGPSWFLEGLPLVVEDELIVLGLDLMLATAEGNQSVINNWRNLYTSETT